jgi:GDPmannose 4,6-dehydratase
VGTAGESRHALITGVSGQDGSFLAELLLEQGYRVTGAVRRRQLGASEHLRDRLSLVSADLLDPDSLANAIAQTKPDELYHLAAPSFVPDSWRHPAQFMAAIAGATATVLESVRGISHSTRVFVATSSTIFGAASESPQTERTPTRPQNPYAAAKLAAHELVGQMRRHDGLYACSGILYNHESERRPEQFVTRKITKAAAAISLGQANALELGRLDSVRDWSFAGDIMVGAWLALQDEQPADYILASGVPHTVAKFAEVAFAHVGLEAGAHIRVEPELVRPPDHVPQVGDPTRAREQLGWEPRVKFEQLVHRMVDHDVRLLEAEGPPSTP